MPRLAADEKVRIARLKGYEGDPCPECGQLTLVRSGACAKCDTCGATRRVLAAHGVIEVACTTDRSHH